MRIKTVNLKRHLTALGTIVLLCGPAMGADVTDLLQDLRQAEPAAAARIERDVQREWSRSGSAAMDLLLKRGRDAMASGDSRTAIEHFTALTDHAPDFAEGWYARATAYHDVELFGPALDDLQKALILNPQHYNAIFGLGVMFQEFDDLERAEQAFRQVLALHPHHENAQTALEQLKRHGYGREL